jgi:MFS family permease
MIHHDLGFSATGLSWVQGAYTLAFGGLLLLGARTGDIFGRRRMFAVGIALFTSASLAAGTAQSATWLLSARTLQGIGAAILAPATLALLTTNFAEGPARTRAVAYYGAVAGASVGLVLGGMLTARVSWRVGFLINVPIGIALMLAARRFLSETDRTSGHLDLAGAASATLGMSALVYGIVRSATSGWRDPVSLAMLISDVLLLALFVVNESARRSRWCHCACSPAASEPPHMRPGSCSSAQCSVSSSSLPCSFKASAATARWRPGSRFYR